MVQYLRQATEDPFFRQQETLDALESLSAADELVIYCGAGVSIDRTGVTWSQLIDDVFTQARATRHDKEAEFDSVRYLIDNLENTKQSASIMMGAFMAPGTTENQFLTPKLHDIIYKESGWSRGYMLRNLIQLSITTASVGRNVLIITTNYDSYIESEFTAQYGRLVANGVPVAALPGIRRRVLGGPRVKHVTVRKHGTATGLIEIVYLHGRVDLDNGPTEGVLVLSEGSYASTQEQSQKVLIDSFRGRSKGVLVIGASLTDEPLINALALTKGDAGERYALIAVPPPVFSPRTKAILPSTISTKTVSEALRLRGAHLGIGVLNPMSHYQSPQFLEELRIAGSAAVKTSNSEYYRDNTNSINYAQRLKSWHELWAARANTKDPEFAYQILHDGLESGIKNVLKVSAPEGEMFRAEVWVRENPRSANRTLTLWANSTGPIRDRQILRREPIQRDSSNASVVAFTDGRPRLLSIRKLGLPVEASRWQTFFSTPIFISADIAIGTDPDNAYIPVGVITLASNLPITDDAGSKKSVFTSLIVSQFEDLKAQLIGMGRTILRATDV